MGATYSVAYLFFAFAVGLATASEAVKRGRSFKRWFILGFIFPLAILALLFLKPATTAPGEQRPVPAEQPIQPWQAQVAAPGPAAQEAAEPATQTAAPTRAPGPTAVAATMLAVDAWIAAGRSGLKKIAAWARALKSNAAPSQPEMLAYSPATQSAIQTEAPDRAPGPAAPATASIAGDTCPHCGYSRTPAGKSSCYNCGRPLKGDSATSVFGPPGTAQPRSTAAQPFSPPSLAVAGAPAVAAAPSALYAPAPTPPQARPTWRPTHRAPAAGMAAWMAPDGLRPPIAQLPPYLELVVETSAGAWAQVRAANGWCGWVDGRLLTPAVAV